MKYASQIKGPNAHLYVFPDTASKQAWIDADPQTYRGGSGRVAVNARALARHDKAAASPEYCLVTCQREDGKYYVNRLEGKYERVMSTGFVTRRAANRARLAMCGGGRLA